MRRFLALTWVIGIGALPWACSNGTSSDDAGVDATVDQAVDAKKDVAVDALKQDSASDALADVVDETFADASDAGDLDATDASDDASDADDAADADDASDADPDAMYDAGLCGSCPTSEVCCTIKTSFNYGKCYSSICLACCM